MNFGRRTHARDTQEEINVIPLIDILLVMVIFLASTTAFTRYSELEVALPDTQAQQTPSEAITLSISRDGRYALDGVLVDNAGPESITQALRTALAARGASAPGTALTIHADAQATHQSVVDAMEAARAADVRRVNVATRRSP